MNEKEKPIKKLYIFNKKNRRGATPAPAPPAPPPPPPPVPMRAISGAASRNTPLNAVASRVEARRERQSGHGTTTWADSQSARSP